MVIEHAAVHAARKPWGVADLSPWSSMDGSGDPVGELWFQRVDREPSDSALLLKLLFTSEPLSIQVHPNDEFARAIGLPNGKTEAWYILSAVTGARVALGLKQKLSRQLLRASIRDGSIAGLAQWHPVVKGDVIFVPAGTIHAIGAGIVLAEIQQRSDTTFRLFDYGRDRELHEDSAVAASDAAPAPPQTPPRVLSAARSALITDTHFVLERIDLDPNSNWAFDTDRETWFLVIEGGGRVGSTAANVGDVIFIEADRADIEVGPDGMSGLIAYPGPDPIESLLHGRSRPVAVSADIAAAVLAPRPNGLIEVRT